MTDCEFGTRDSRRGNYILGSFIDAVSWSEAEERVKKWSLDKQSRYVCICNVHVVVTAYSDLRLRQVVNVADMATPDGMPLAWVLRRCGHSGQERVNGPDFMLRLCAVARENGLPIYLYGSTPETLDSLKARLAKVFPGLMVAGTMSPPFRPLTLEEDEDVVREINGSGAGIVFVGLGCPKQELWMAEHKGRINAVMIGIGAAFDFHAGKVKRAPHWMRSNGLEWLYRLCREPRRLFRRYFVTNSIFLWHWLKNDLHEKR